MLLNLEAELYQKYRFRWQVLLVFVSFVNYYTTRCKLVITELG